MKKPAYVPHFPIKTGINYTATFSKLYRTFKDPSTIRPGQLTDEARQAFGFRTLKRPLPQLKGNVYQTMKEILHIFLSDWRKAARTINLAIRTNRAALAQRCRNRDPKTAYLHILTLIEHGFLRAKFRLGKKGLQLLLNPELLVWEGVAPIVPLTYHGNALALPPVAAAPALAALATGAAGAPLNLRDHLAQLAENLKSKFSTGSTRRR